MTHLWVLRVSPVSRVFQNTHIEQIIQHISWQAIQSSDRLKTLQSQVGFFYVSPHSFRLFYIALAKHQHSFFRFTSSYLYHFQSIFSPTQLKNNFATKPRIVFSAIW